MVVVVIVLAVVALAAVVVAALARRALVAQRRLAAQATEAAQRSADDAAAQAIAAAEATEAARAEAAEAAAETERVRHEASRFDADVLWALEQRRTERTWRVSVAPSPEVPSGLAEAAHPLVAALQIEMAALREEVGTVVELDAAIPDDIAPGAAVLTLRVAQELLATVVREAEETVLRVRVERGDVAIVVEATDENGERVTVGSLGLPVSAGVEQTADGAVVHGAVTGG